MRFIVKAMTVLCISGFSTGVFSDEVTDQIDKQIWIPVMESVREADYDQHAATFHPSAIMVFEMDSRTMLASEFLKNVKTGFAKRKGGPKTTTVQFRFNQRLHDECTAFESGVFLFRSPDKEGVVKDHYIHFEFLLIYENGRWLTLMEKQKQRVTITEWNAAGTAGRIE